MKTESSFGEQQAFSIDKKVITEVSQQELDKHLEVAKLVWGAEGLWDTERLQELIDQWVVGVSNSKEIAPGLIAGNRFEHQILGLEACSRLKESGRLSAAQATEALKYVGDNYAKFYSIGQNTFLGYDPEREKEDDADGRIESDEGFYRYDTRAMKAIRSLACSFSDKEREENNIEDTYLQVVQNYITSRRLIEESCFEWNSNNPRRLENGNYVYPGDPHGRLERTCLNEERLQMPWEEFLNELKSEKFRNYFGGYGGGEYDVQPEVDEDLGAVYAIISTLETVGGRKSVDLLIALLEHDPCRIANSVGDAISKIDAGYGAEKLLPLLKDSDDEVRHAVETSLFRLEFGNIGVSDEGVKYLGKMFDLGEHNNSRHTARRLTNKGHIGVFDDQKRLFKYFQPDGLTNEQAVIRANVLDFTYETLFKSRGKEAPEESRQREQYLREFLESYFSFYENDFFQRTGVRFNNLSFPEQGQLLLFFKGADEETKNRVIEFVRMYREDGFRAFLSLEYGREFGEKILAIGDRFLREDRPQVAETNLESMAIS